MRLLLLACLVLPGALAYPSGNIGTGTSITGSGRVCETLNPQDSTSSHTLSSNPSVNSNSYTIDVPDYYDPGQTLTMNVSSTTGTNFRGIFTQCRKDGNITPVGKFVDANFNRRQVPCAGLSNNSTLIQRGSINRNFVSMTWEAPSDLTGNIVCHVTVIRSQSHFVSNMLSTTMTQNPDQNTGGNTGNTNTGTGNTNTGTGNTNTGTGNTNTGTGNTNTGTGNTNTGTGNTNTGNGNTGNTGGGSSSSEEDGSSSESNGSNSSV